MPKIKYGIQFPDEINDLEMELFCFRTYRPRRKGGLDGYGHLEKVIKTIWPKMKWHDWLEWRMKRLCEHSVNAWIGAGACGKTFDAGLFAFCYFLADPKNTAVILTSTTGKMVRKRIWPVIQDLYYSASGRLPGNLVDSKTTLQAEKGDDKHGIYAIAVKEGNTASAVANIQGLHAERILMIIDEATDTPEAVFEAISNLKKGCLDFRLIVIGNPVSYLDPHGRVCEPEKGWSSVNVDHEEWETKGVDAWEIPSGVCLHFDGYKSPNVKAGQRKWPFLISQEDIASAAKAHQGEDTLGFWKYTRGFYAPEGTCKTVMSEPMVEKHDGRGSHIFISRKVTLCALDPAFGGDRCVLRLGYLGDIEGGKLGLQLGERHELKIKPGKDKHYQIVEQVMAIIETHRIDAKHYGMDVSGEGGGTAEILGKQWRPDFNWVEFGGKPSDLVVSDEDKRPANEVYDRKVTELWFSCRRVLISGQLKGLLPGDILEFCSREFTDEKRKIKLDTKADCKAKLGRSPDDGDAIAVLVEVARRNGLVSSGTSITRTDQDWLVIARKKADVFASEDQYEHSEPMNSYLFGPEL